MNLSIFEQSPRLRDVYTQLCFCYPVADGASITAIVQTLTSGLERLTASFPWLAGQVVNEGASKGNTGIFKILPFGKLPHLVVKNLMNDDLAPTMDALRESNFPFRMLEENLICPRMTLAGRLGETLSDPSPVLLLQANFITGGLLLTIVASHSTMDIVGQVQMIYLLSKACGNEPFTGEEVKNGNLDRRSLIHVLDDRWEPDPKEFPGNVTTKTTNISTLQKLTDQSLGDVASQLRSVLDPEILKYKFQAGAKSQIRTLDKSAKSPVDRTKYIVMSSWSKVDCYEFDFTLGLGRPESVRRPQFSPVEGVVYLLPKALDGEIVAGLCLRDDDMEMLKVDKECVKYGQYIG